MFSIGLLFMVVVIGVVVGVMSMRHHSASTTLGMAHPAQPRHVARGAFVQPLFGPPAPARARRVPLVAEALGYLGGMLSLIGITVWVATFWRDVSAPVRLGVSGGVAALLVAVGFAVRADTDEALARLRGFVWFTGSLAFGVTGGVVAHDVLHTTSPVATVQGVALGVLVVSMLLWQVHDRPAQEFSTLVALEVAVGVGAWQIGSPVFAALVEMAVAGTVMALGLWRRILTPWLATIVGTIGVLAGASMFTQRWQERGTLPLVAMAFLVLLLAETPTVEISGRERIGMLVIGTIALWISVPPTVAYFGHHHGIVSGLVMWLVGVSLVGLAALREVVHPVLVEMAGGLTAIAGAAVTGLQHQGFATLFGLASALAMLAVATMSGRVLMSVTGSLGLLANVPWAIGHFFPSENLAPLLIAVSGVLVVGVAVVLTRMGGRFRKELRR